MKLTNIDLARAVLKVFEHVPREPVDGLVVLATAFVAGARCQERSLEDMLELIRAMWAQKMPGIDAAKLLLDHQTTETKQ